MLHREPPVDELLQRSDPDAEVILDKLRIDPAVANFASTTAISICGL
jgi:hypothetical protein